jgi:RNA polymerase sigma-70 factor (ECF subfamily)
VPYDHFSDKIDQFARGLIRRKVEQLIGKAGFTAQDRKDLEQELLLRLVKSLPSYDPSKSHLYAFITTVLERYVANVLRNKRADKRDQRRITSLSVMIYIEGEGPVELAQTISQLELDARRHAHSRSDEERAQLAMDLADVVAKLPPDLRDLAQRLMSQSPSEAARDLDIPRTTLYEKIRRLRRHFEDAGLRDYL